ncbi:MAG: M28 family peptidase [Candidatus Krumholzibacteria bacterium]|nr:M28 family peptidase [Candidatus Krumholzibacteria bacterium]
MKHDLRRSAICLASAGAALALLAAGAPSVPKYGTAAPDRDSLASFVEWLSIDPSTSQPRSRYVFREAELAVVADTLAARLSRFTGRDAVRQTFEIEESFEDHDSTFTAENIILRVPADGASSGVLLVTAHFDAIGRRTDGWAQAWETEPAPGADDNATGTALVIEAARVLAGADLPFDLEFVLFSAEELGKLGSIDFVSRCDAACAEEILGVINLDMIGYSGDGFGASCMSDFRSGWLADCIVSYAASIDPAFPLTVIKPGPYNWDHAPFWEREEGRLPAVTLSEPLGEYAEIIYPWYHTVEDLPPQVDFDQVVAIGEILTGFIGSFAGAPAEMAVLPSDLLMLVGGAIRHENVFEAGEEIAAWVRVRNIGGSMPEGGSISLTVTHENSLGRRTIYADEVGIPEPLRSSDVTIPLASADADAGENRITASIRVSGMSDSALDNEADARFVVVGTPRVLAGHHMQPNPVSRTFSEAMLCLDLAAEADLIVKLFTIEGEHAGTARLGGGYGYPIPVGMSCHRCGEIFTDAAELSSGIYLYHIVVFERSGSRMEATGRFAVAN